MKGYGVYADEELIAWFPREDSAEWYKNEQEEVYGFDSKVSEITIKILEG